VQRLQEESGVDIRMHRGINMAVFRLPRQCSACGKALANLDSAVQRMWQGFWFSLSCGSGTAAGTCLTMGVSAVLLWQLKS
jgi:ribosomal protein L37AE/L43A